jgi:hypothetical protein
MGSYQFIKSRIILFIHVVHTPCAPFVAARVDTNLPFKFLPRPQELQGLDEILLGCELCVGASAL